MNDWVEWRKKEGRVTQEKRERWQDGEMTVEQGGIKLYKTHVSLSTMEKVKAHDRYKHICYWVLQLLYFDGVESVISTQVGLFDSMCVCVLLWFYSTVAWLFIFVNVHCTSTKPEKTLLWTYVNTTPDPLVVVLPSAVRNRQSYGSLLQGFSIVQWKHTLLRTHKRDAGLLF